MTEPDGHPKTYRPERLPPAAERTLGEGSLRTALTVARYVHQTGKATSFQAPKTVDERWEVAQQLRPTEEQQLTAWANRNDSWVDAADFTAKWQEGGEIEGGKHQLYEENGLVFKRNNLLYHTTWLEYFHRLVLHNWLFPETTLRFIGLMRVGGQLQPVVTQKALLAVRGADRAEVEAEMNKRGFYRRKADNYYNPDLGILVEDLHDENVLVSPQGSLLIFDPVVYLVKSDMELPMPDFLL